MKPIHSNDLAHVMEQSRRDFEALSGASLLVTGATGFVGSWILETAAFANRAGVTNIRLYALVHPELDLDRAAPHIARLDGVTILRGDIRTLTLAELIEQHSGVGELDAVIHTAIAVDARTLAVDPMPTLDTAVEGTRRVLGLAQSTGVARFLFLSSGAIYGKPSPPLVRIPESYLGGPDATNPLSAYAEGKRIGETMCACVSRAYGMETVMARGFAFVGPHLPIDRHFAIGNFIRDALHGGPVIVSSDGTPVRSYQYAADMASWLWGLLVRGQSGRAYNVGASRAVSVRDVAALVSAAGECGVEVRGTIGGDSTPDRYVPDVRLATETLDLRETIDLEDAIERTLRWHRSST